MANKFFKVKIIKHTRLLTGNSYHAPWYKSIINKIILVKNVDWQSAYYEAKNGLSVLKNDCLSIAKRPVR